MSHIKVLSRVFILISTSFLLNPEAFAAGAITTGSTNVATNMGLLDSLIHASLVVQLTILILLSLSVLSWAIGWAKFQQFKTLKEANQNFDKVFWSSSSLDDLFSKVDSHHFSSHARVFKAAYLEMKKIAESPMSNPGSGATGSEVIQLSGMENLERSVRKSSENEIAEMENRLTILATTGSTGPFIGLFGTVWGIMGSFHQIGQTGSASLAAVAPGISEALITTAIGLAAAIPAVVIYNNCIAVIRKEEISLNNFSTDFLNIVKRNFFKG
ncbi:MAG: MotA/TolQ/ExbB proton channel family protein [Pseudobdellovibrio sp.]